MAVIKKGTRVYGYHMWDKRGSSRREFTLTEDFDQSLCYERQAYTLPNGKGSVWAQTIEPLPSKAATDYQSTTGQNLSQADVEELRKYAVRDTLRPGLYRYVYSHLGQWTDIFVTHINPDGRTFMYYSLSQSLVVELKGFLTDAGVLPQNQTEVTQTCNLGHVHTVEVEPRYNTNFMVPIEIQGRVKTP